MPLGVHAAKNLRHALPETLAVVRDENDELAQVLRAQGLGIVVNPRAGAGIGTSIASGIAAIGEVDGAVIALADMPCVLPETIAQVAGAIADGAILAAPYYRGRRGHPVGFARSVFPILSRLTGDQGARDLLTRADVTFERLEVDDPGILRDIDSGHDLAVVPVSVQE